MNTSSVTLLKSLKEFIRCNLKDTDKQTFCLNFKVDPKSKNNRYLIRNRRFFGFLEVLK